MKRQRQRKLNNFGYSLVEVIVALAIVSIAATAIFEFAIVASKQYQKESLEAEIQYEAQLVMNQLQELLIDASEGVSYAYGAGNNMILADDEIGGAATEKNLTVYNDDKYFVIKWDGTQEKLLYTEYTRNNEGDFVKTADEALMAEFVRSFSVDISQLEENHGVRLDVTFDNKREYQVTQNVTLRNKVVVNKTLTEVYAD